MYVLEQYCPQSVAKKNSGIPPFVKLERKLKFSGFLLLLCLLLLLIIIIIIVLILLLPLLLSFSAKIGFYTHIYLPANKSFEF